MKKLLIFVIPFLAFFKANSQVQTTAYPDIDSTWHTDFIDPNTFNFIHMTGLKPSRFLLYIGDLWIRKQNVNAPSEYTGYFAALDDSGTVKRVSAADVPLSDFDNDAGFLSSETDPLFNTKFASKTTDGLAEGITNLYFTNARARAANSAGTGIGYSGGVITNTAPDQMVTITAGAGINLSGTYPNFTVTNTSPGTTPTITAGRGISITGTWPTITIAMVTPTITIRNTTNGNARTLNSNFTVDANKEADVTYTVTCSVTNPLLIGTSTATAFLEYSTDGGTTWQLPSQAGNSSGVGVTVTLQLTNGQTGTLVGTIPANALVRIRTATTGTASVTYVTGQETVY